MWRGFYKEIVEERERKEAENEKSEHEIRYSKIVHMNHNLKFMKTIV